MHDVLEQFVLRVAFADDFPADLGEAAVLEQGGGDFLNGEQRVVELRVADDTEATAAVSVSVSLGFEVGQYELLSAFGSQLAESN